MTRLVLSSNFVAKVSLGCLTALAMSTGAQLPSDESRPPSTIYPKPNRQVISLVPGGPSQPPPPPSRPRQVIDLRPSEDLVAQNNQLSASDSPLELLALTPSDRWSELPKKPANALVRELVARHVDTPTSTEPNSPASRSKQGSPPWVDLAIPKPFFDEAQMAPRDFDPPSIPPSTSNQSNSNGQPNEVALPDLSNALPSESPNGAERQTAPVGPSFSTVPLAPPSERVPGQTYTPQQAIPNSVYQEGGQQPPVIDLPSPPTASPHRNVQPTEQVPAQPGIPNVEPPNVRTGEAPPDNVPPPVVAEPVEAVKVDEDKGTRTASNAKRPLLEMMPHDHRPAHVDALARKTGFSVDDFAPEGGPQGSTFNPHLAASVYRGKYNVPVQRPLVELWRPLYTSGIYPPALTWFGETNPMKPHFLVYGDMRTAVGASRNAAGKQHIWGNVLNLDMDLQLTSTERLHMFVSPLNKATTATGLNFGNNVDVIDGVNFDPVTLFFEGDVGAMMGGATNQFTQYDLPFTLGLIPLIYQNGIWANDAVLGAAVALPSRHSRRLGWANFDATLFWATDKITTDAFKGQDSAADMFGTAWFIDAYDGYIEADYAYLADNAGGGRSYHNLAFAFTRRYFSRVSNSLRYIVNLGQHDLAEQDRTADGHLLLIENSFISRYPNVIVPYFNMFYGQGRPQSLARAGLAGGILTNTGINFETDGITNYPTLDATANNTFGFATGVNLLGAQFSHQLVLEFAMLIATGDPTLRNAEGDQYAVGLRYQKPLSHRLIFRTDHMAGFREGTDNIHGSRFEFRWKF